MACFIVPAAEAVAATAVTNNHRESGKKRKSNIFCHYYMLQYQHKRDIRLETIKS